MFHDFMSLAVKVNRSFGNVEQREAALSDEIPLYFQRVNSLKTTRLVTENIPQISQLSGAKSFSAANFVYKRRLWCNYAT